MNDSSNTGVVDRVEKALETLTRIRAEIGESIFGQDTVIERVLTGILAGGHVLLVGTPGLAKTLLVRTAARVLGLDWARVQFTPDLMPSDILGSEVLEEKAEGGRGFRFVPGPVFTSLLMADEINRASPRTQSALLQAMQERQVTIAGHNHELPPPFHVLATQNPLEQEGTYPLPEAQLDRFMLRIEVPWPDREAERDVLIETTGAEIREARPVVEAGALTAMQALVRDMPVPETLVEAILGLIRSARPELSDDERVCKHVEWGPSPRAGQALMLTVRARALLRGRLAPALDDLRALAAPALSHRMALTFDPSGTGPKLPELIDDLVDRAGRA